MPTIAQARDQVVSQIVDGPPSSLTPSKVRQVLLDVVDALAADLPDLTSFAFTYSTTTTMADPGTGAVRFNHATLASVTAIAIDDLAADTGNPNVSPWILTWDDSTNTSKGLLRFRKATDVSVYVDFIVTGLTDNSGWTQIAVTYVGKNGTLVNGDSLIAVFAPTGNKGVDGAGAGDMLKSDNLAGLANTATARTNLGFSANGSSLVTAASYAAMRTLLDLEAGTDFYSKSAADTLLNAKANAASPVFSGAMTGTHTLQWGLATLISGDLNDLRHSSGFHMGFSLSNSPDGSASWFYVLVQIHASTYASQTAWTLTVGATPKMWIRLYVASEWGPWTEVLTTASAATAAEYRTGTATKPITVDQAWAAAALATLTDAATIAVDMATFVNATVTLGGNRTLGSPTNEKVGQSGMIVIVQDGTGSRTLAYGSEWKFAGGVAPVLSTAAGSVDVLFYMVRATGFVLASLTKGWA